MKRIFAIIAIGMIAAAVSWRGAAQDVPSPAPSEPVAVKQFETTSTLHVFHGAVAGLVPVDKKTKTDMMVATCKAPKWLLTLTSTDKIPVDDKKVIATNDGRNQVSFGIGDPGMLLHDTPDDALGKDFDFQLEIIWHSAQDREFFVSLVPPPGPREDGADCSSHNQCRSGVCDHIKMDMGRCATERCVSGDRADNNHFFCNMAGRWQKSKLPEDNCVADLECFQPTCFMIPTCDITDIPQTRASCKNNVCVHSVGRNECEMQGMVKVLAKDEYLQGEDGTCMESMAQRILQTVCAPCGNGVCDSEVESACNCPQDCKQ